MTDSLPSLRTGNVEKTKFSAMAKARTIGNTLPQLEDYACQDILAS
jgi:hypothetical protein